jgi:hypothetical protein
VYPSAADHPEIPPRRRHGCLWGCLGVLAIFLLLGGGGGGYTAWRLYKTMQSDPQLTAILDQVHADPRAADILGGDFEVMQSEKLTFPLPGSHKFATTYKVVVIGGYGQCQVDVRLEGPQNDGKIVLLTVTGADGRRVQLVPGGAPADGPSATDSI